MGHPFNLRGGEGGEWWTIFEINYFERTLCEINNLLQELPYKHVIKTFQIFSVRPSRVEINNLSATTPHPPGDRMVASQIHHLT